MIYIIYAIADRGDGKVAEVGRFETGEEYEIPVWAFARDVLIRIDPDYSVNEHNKDDES